MTRIAVIGAGPVGMALVTALKLAGKAEIVWFVRNFELREKLQQEGLQIIIQDKRATADLGKYAPEDPDNLPATGLSRAETVLEAVQALRDAKPDITLKFSEGEIIAIEETLVEAKPDIVFSCTKADSVLPVRSTYSPYLKCLLFFVANGFWMHPGMDLGIMFGGGFAAGEHVSLIPEGRLVLGRIKSPHAEFLTSKSEDVPGTLIYRHEEFELLESLVSLFDEQFIRLEIQPDIYPIMARKAALNCLINPLAALAAQPNAILLLPDAKPIVNKLCEEVVEVMVAARIMPARPNEFTVEDLISDFTRLCVSAGANRGSLQIDRMLGRRGEIQYLNGLLLGIAQRFGMNMPMNTTILSLLQFQPLI